MSEHDSTPEETAPVHALLKLLWFCQHTMEEEGGVTVWRCQRCDSPGGRCAPDCDVKNALTAAYVRGDFPEYTGAVKR